MPAESKIRFFSSDTKETNLARPPDLLDISAISRFEGLSKAVTFSVVFFYIIF